METVCLECKYKCGTPRALVFHFKIEHKDKVSKCEFGDESISCNCVGGIVSKIRGTASKCSSSNLRSFFTDSSSSYSFSTSSNSSSSSSSCSSSNSKSNSNSNSNSDPNSGSDSNSNFSSNSNSNSNSNSSSNSYYVPFPIPSTITDPNPKNSHNSHNSHIEIKFDITNKICNRCGVIKQIKSFDKKEIFM